MDFKNLNWAMVAAGIASIGVFWTQFKAIWDQLTSLVFVTATSIGEVPNKIVMRYCWDHYVAGRFGKRAYDYMHDFIRPDQANGWVPVKSASSSMIFWKGIWPIFIESKYDPNTGTITSLTFLRGTFDADGLMLTASNHYNKVQRTNNNHKRYFVRRFHGEAPSMGEGKGKVHAATEKYNTSKSRQIGGWQIIGYKDEELGAPSSESPFDNLCYASNVEGFVEYLERWKNSKKWYMERSIPWRSGALLYGRPGTGKTSFVRAVGQKLDIPVALMDLTSMSNEELNEAWKMAMDMSPVIILFEDLDRVFNKDQNQISDSMLKAPLTFDALLNCMSGIDPANGVLVMVTANDVTKIDASIGEFATTGVSSRPGRLDIALEFKELDEKCRRIIANKILVGLRNEFVEKVIADGDMETGAQFTKRCSDIALKDYWDKADLIAVQDVAIDGPAAPQKVRFDIGAFGDPDEVNPDDPNVQYVELG